MNNELVYFQRIISRLRLPENRLSLLELKEYLAGAARDVDQVQQDWTIKFGLPLPEYYSRKLMVQIREMLKNLSVLQLQRHSLENNDLQTKLLNYLSKITRSHLIKLDRFLALHRDRNNKNQQTPLPYKVQEEVTQPADESAAITERYQFLINAGTDALFDLSFSQETVFCNERFKVLTGYELLSFNHTVNWLFKRIHPQDKQQVRLKIAALTSQRIQHWNMTFRFLPATGHYLQLEARFFCSYQHKKLVRVLGILHDLTPQNELEHAIVKLKRGKKKLIGEAIIAGQEEERNKISRELHDNVNQLLVSARVYISIAKKGGKERLPHLDKASQFISMAVEEIRELARGLSSILILKEGLIPCINDIAHSMLLRKIVLHLSISEHLVLQLTNEQQLMVYRIIQEQCNNILKYAQTAEASISLQQVNEEAELLICDRGKGFDSKKKATGIGFMNIYNRVDAFNGRVTIESAPGEGCRVLVYFPLKT